MATAGDDGVPLRVHLERDAEGILPNPLSAARLASEPPLPPAAADMWATFLDLHQRRPQSEFGPLRLPWSELQAYSGEIGRPLSKWQRDTIFALEDAFFAVRAENKK